MPRKLKFTKSVLAFLCFLVLDCKSHVEPKNGKPVENTQDAISLPGPQETYALKDTFFADGGPMQYYAAALWTDEKLIDTVQLGFGFSEFGEGKVIYQRLFVTFDTLWSSNRDTMFATTLTGIDSGLYVYDRQTDRKTNISHRLAYFGDFASPSFSSNALLYWGVTPGNDSGFGIYAMRFDLLTDKMDSVYLFRETLETDNTTFFSKVFFENGRYRYQGTGENSALLDSGFQRIR